MNTRNTMLAQQMVALAEQDRALLDELAASGAIPSAA